MPPSYKANCFSYHDLHPDMIASSEPQKPHPAKIFRLVVPKFEHMCSKHNMFATYNQPDTLKHALTASHALAFSLLLCFVQKVKWLWLHKYSE